MDNKEKDIDILEHIIKYCNEILDTQSYFGNSYEIFKVNPIYRNAVAMCLLQIGELSGNLSAYFKETYNGVPWRNIKGMRNIVAHKYGDISITTVWEAITDDTPALLDYCKDALLRYANFD